MLVSRVSRVVETALALPAPPLRALVDSYQGSLLEGFAPGTHSALPTASIALVISLGAPLRIACREEGDDYRRFPAVIAGLRTKPAAIAHDGSAHDLSVALTPDGARLLGVNAAALGGRMVELSEILGRRADALSDQLHAAKDWRSRFTVLDRFLLDRLERLKAPETALSLAWRRLLASGGAVPVARLASEVGYGRRHLHQRFTAEYGVTPKHVARLARFQRSVRRIRAAEHRRRRSPSAASETLAAVAAEVGYFDQSHMAREWREMAGRPPSEWVAAEELPFVQDERANGDAVSEP